VYVITVPFSTSVFFVSMKKPEAGYASADDVEAAFYTAFTRCDLDTMQTLWTRDGAVCVHPGAAPIKGYEDILRSWQLIFSDAERPNVRINVIQRIAGDDLVVHMLEEHISSPGVPWQGAVVFATNIYRRDGQGWLMVAHNASAMPTQRTRVRTLQ
jgi:ketosteroid isomerase-like protein